MVRSTTTYGVCVMLLLASCSSAGAEEPTAIVCEVLSWDDPVAVSFPLDDGFEEVRKDVDIGGLMLIEFSHKGGGIAWNVIDTSSGERDYISFYDPFTPLPRLEPVAIGEVVKDKSGTHPATGIGYRILCKGA